MLLHRIITLSFITILLTGCTNSSSVSTLRGTGTYPNSVYVSTESKPLETAVFGASSSPVQLKIFSDYQCPACINFHEAVEERLWKDYINTKKITVSFYNYPLTMTSAGWKAMHENAEWDALAGLCALSFGKFQEYRTEMYELEHEKSGAIVTDNERIELAKKVGITDASFWTCLQSAWYQKTLESEIAEGNRLNLQGTPSVYLNDKPLSFRSTDELFKMIDAVLSKNKSIFGGNWISCPIFKKFRLNALRRFCYLHWTKVRNIHHLIPH